MDYLSITGGGGECTLQVHLGEHEWRSVKKVMRAIAFHQRGPGSNPGVDAICVLSLLLVLSLLREVFLRALRFSPLQHQHLQTLPTLPNSSSIWNTWTRFNEFLKTPKCSVGKQITITKPYSPHPRQNN